MKIERMTSIPSLDTHTTPYFQIIMKDMFKLSRTAQMVIADPFARDCELAGRWTNDIDPNTKAKQNLDALDFLCTLNSSSFDAIIFDPPFSTRQADRYEAGHVNVYTDPGYVSQCFSEIERALKPGGLVVKFGYNSTRHQHTLDLVKIWLVNFGGNHNDVIVSIWEKNTHTLEEWN